MMDSDETIITLLKKGYNEIKRQYKKPNIKNIVNIFGIGTFFLALGAYPLTNLQGYLLICLSIFILVYRFKYYNGIFAGDKFLLDVGVIIPLLFILGIKKNSIEHLKHLATILGIGYIVYYGKQLVSNVYK